MLWDIFYLIIPFSKLLVITCTYLNVYSNLLVAIPCIITYYYRYAFNLYSRERIMQVEKKKEKKTFLHITKSQMHGINICKMCPKNTTQKPQIKIIINMIPFRLSTQRKNKFFNSFIYRNATASIERIMWEYASYVTQTMKVPKKSFIFTSIHVEQ